MFSRARVYLTAALLALGLTATAVSAEGLKGISHRDKIYDLVIRGDEIFAVGFPGLLLHSSDRGQSWELMDIGTDNALFAIDMAAKGKGVIVGRSGLLYTTTDGGKSWTAQKSGIREHLFDVELLDSGRAWAVGHFGTILHSKDGGKSWSAQQYDATLPELPEAEKGDGHGGRRDHRISIAEMENEGAVEEARLNAVCFVDDQQGWIGGEFGLLLHTTDGGKSWRRQVNSAGKLIFSLRAVDERHLLATGVEGNLVETRDGGQTWKTVDTGVEEHLLDIWPVGDGYYLVGRDGIVLAREGEGEPFKRLDLGIYAWLGTVRFLDAKTGFVAGGRGSLLKTTDAGAGWQRLSPVSFQALDQAAAKAPEKPDSPQGRRGAYSGR